VVIFLLTLLLNTLLGVLICSAEASYITLDLANIVAHQGDLVSIKGSSNLTCVIIRIKDDNNNVSLMDITNVVNGRFQLNITIPESWLIDGVSTNYTIEAIIGEVSDTQTLTVQNVGMRTEIPQTAPERVEKPQIDETAVAKPSTIDVSTEVSALSSSNPFIMDEETVGQLEINISNSINVQNNISTLTVNFGLVNISDIPRNVTCIVSLYKGENQFVSMKKQSASIVQGTPQTLTIPTILPVNTEDYYVKIFVWDTFGNLTPITLTRKISDFDPYGREKFILVTKSQNDTFNITMRGINSKYLNQKIHTITYDPTKVEVLDLCAFTYMPDLTTGRILGTNITIQSFNPQTGKIVLVFDPPLLNNQRITSINNIIKFKATMSLLDEQILYNIN